MTTTANTDFVHLHVHTEYSMLDGASLLNGLFERVTQQGMSAIAMSDHGNLHGAYDFYTKARQHGVKPIIGIEAYITPGTHRSERRRVKWGLGSANEEGGDDVSGGGAYTHMTMWAENTTGLHNLYRLSSRSFAEGYFYKPRMDKELLAEYSEGIIVSTGCPSGAVQTRLRLGQYDEAVKEAQELQDIFGPQNVYLELMDHGLSIERRVRNDLLRLGKQLNITPLATNDSHYNNPEDAEAQEALLCVNARSTLSEPTYAQGGKRFAFDGTGYYIKSAAEMRHLWDSQGLMEACDATLEVAERCEITMEESTGTYMPHPPVPEGQTEEEWFRAEVWRGIEERYPGTALTHAVKDRVTMELDVVAAKGYCGYYLVVADFIKWAKGSGIRVGPGRGSGAGSIAAYALGITGLDPLEHGLLFERFLNPERPSMPDFDIDIDDHRRGEVIAYVTEKYGSERVAQIGTFGRIKAKAAIKDAARILDHPFGVGDRITKVLPQNLKFTLPQIFDAESSLYAEGAEFRTMYEAQPDVQKIYHTALGLEGQIRQTGVHAAGVIMSNTPLIDVIPLMDPKSDGQTITQFEYPTCEALGLVKMDFLGLSNLSTLDNAVENVQANRGETIILEDLPFDDAATYDLMGRGDTLGVFQLDGSGMRSLLRSMQPTEFADITAVSALYRPGPMGMDSHTNYAHRKNGRQEVEPIHPELAEALEPILGETFGLVVYQEQVMEIAQRLAGYSLGAADNMRRIMGKKKPEALAKEFGTFEAGMVANGFHKAAIKKLWDVLVPFAEYAFNKSHSAAYGVITYWTAYMKANYRAEYMAALLQSATNDKDKMPLYLTECRRMGITVLPPDVNDSSAKFTAVGEDIRFGLLGIRNVGEGPVEGILQARSSEGAFNNFTDFLDKVPDSVCNKKVIESLIKAGGFDSIENSRRALMVIHEMAVDAVKSVKRKEAEGQFDLFGFSQEGPSFQVDVPDLPEFDKKSKLAFEREMLRLYVSDHPLSGLEHVLGRAADTQILDITSNEDFPDNHTVKVAGLITVVDRRIAKASGKPYGIVTLEDLSGPIEVGFFGDTYLAYETVLAPDAVVAIKGKTQRRDEAVTLRAVEVSLPDTSGGTDSPLMLNVPQNRCVDHTIAQLNTVLNAYPGDAEVHVTVEEPGKRTTLRTAHRVEKSPSLVGDLKALLGPACLSDR
ncbi:MAG: DNA polymerase III subunit alpha [Cellulomonadaceae bacterium]|jgi:DNA polymerase-3 subunit alpha|nr:DNA polymerase III subunit alpha [Cellulomonadaceae bacterium]